jgi:RNA polymerase sigma-70 factor (ECF subfamily)
MKVLDPFQQGLLDALPYLRRYSYQLVRNTALAEDMVQETAVRALTYRHRFTPGTNLRGWLTIILRNRYFNETRRSGYARPAQLDEHPTETAVSGGQEESLELNDLKRHFHYLPREQKEALSLVGVSGYSYEDAASIAGCPVGTIKSRVCRARTRLQFAVDGGQYRDQFSHTSSLRMKERRSESAGT